MSFILGKTLEIVQKNTLYRFLSVLFAMLKNVFLVIYVSTYNNVHNNVTYTKYNTGGKLMPILAPSGGWEGDFLTPPLLEANVL